MWLKGELAGATDGAVRLALAAGPVNLALGMGLFYVVGALHSLRGSEEAAVSRSDLRIAADDTVPLRCHWPARSIGALLL
ncbi:hypothetical protein [Mycobacterium sp. URHB0021]|jgi:hypothetical protein